ncbi:hypothetical protein ACIU0H_04950 [Pseudomonas aeruginosa]
MITTRTASAERPEGTADLLAIVREAVAGAYNEWKMTSEAVTEIMEAHERIVGELRAENAKLSEALDRWPLIRDILKLRLADALARVAALTATRNRHGVDANYFNKNLQRILRDFESFTPDELARSLIILAKVADEKVVAQAQHSVPEGFRELLEMLVVSDLRKIRYAGAWRREVHNRASSILALLAAAPGKEVGHE